MTMCCIYMPHFLLFERLIFNKSFYKETSACLHSFLPPTTVHVKYLSFAILILSFNSNKLIFFPCSYKTNLSWKEGEKKKHPFNTVCSSFETLIEIKACNKFIHWSVLISFELRSVAYCKSTAAHQLNNSKGLMAIISSRVGDKAFH